MDKSFIINTAMIHKAFGLILYTKIKNKNLNRKHKQ